MDAIEKAFIDAPRANFLPEDIKDQAGLDTALPIGFGQTNSQPTTVRMMLEWLEPQKGEKILDVGSGSGWTAALLANLVGAKGRVYAVEIIPELVEMGRTNCQRIGIKNTTFHRARDNYGLKKWAPYDRILVSAAASKLPKELLDQLRIGGKLVIPVQNDVLEIAKISSSDFETTQHPGFVFVPLV